MAIAVTKVATNNDWRGILFSGPRFQAERAGRPSSYHCVTRVSGNRPAIGPMVGQDTRVGEQENAVTVRIGAVHLGWNVLAVAAGGGGKPVRPLEVEGSYTPPAY